MSYILTFVAAQHNLSPDIIHLAAPHHAEISWLADNKAVEFETPNNLTISEIEAMREHLAVHQVDVFCTPSCNRRKKLFIADMDATIVTSETLDELADEAGIKHKIAAITQRAMQGDINFHDALRERVQLIKDLPESALKNTLDKTETSEGADILLKTLSNNNVFTALVSGGFTYYTDAIAKKLGFDANHGNELELEDGKLTGKVIDPILDKHAKLAYLKQYVQDRNIKLSDSVAIGDGANDLAMLEAAGLGIGYQPKPLVREKILNCIIHTDLTSVLYMQGYKLEEILL